MKIEITTDQRMRKDGKINIILYFSAKQKRRQQILFQVFPDQWDSKNNQITGSTIEARNQNLKIKKVLYKIEVLRTELELIGEALTWEKIQRNVFHESTGTLNELVEREIMENHKAYAFGTLKRYRSNLNITRQFQDPVYFSDINKRWIDAFYKFLSDKGNTHNAIVVKLRFVRKFCKMAMREGMIRKNPFEDYKIKEQETFPVYCTPEELEKLENFYNSMDSGPRKEILQRFLFFAFCGGIRVSDWDKVTGKHIQEKKISIKMEKTQNNLVIPIGKRAMKYVPKTTSGEPVFKKMAGQYMNRQLQAIAEEAGVNKPISTKSARHSFATLFLSRGGNIFTLKNILGHKDIESTLVYSRLVDTTMKNQMDLID